MFWLNIGTFSVSLFSTSFWDILHIIFGNFGKPILFYFSAYSNLNVSQQVGVLSVIKQDSSRVPTYFAEEPSINNRDEKNLQTILLYCLLKV